jgi:threonine synthase
LAGIRKLTAVGIIRRDSDVVAVLTGNVLKDPDFIHGYHTGTLKGPDGAQIVSNFGNSPVIVPYNIEAIADKLSE